MTTESDMIPSLTASNRLRTFGYRLETSFDGAKRVWLHYHRPGRSGKMRIYSGKVFLRDVQDAEGARGQSA